MAIRERGRCSLRLPFPLALTGPHPLRWRFVAPMSFPSSGWIPVLSSAAHDLTLTVLLAQDEPSDGDCLVPAFESQIPHLLRQG